jgi:hypothetical protein
MSAILSEYLQTLRMSDDSGVGKKLAIRLWRRRYDQNVCQLVAITPIVAPAGSFEEVPLSLRDFDRDDQKFFAVAVGTHYESSDLSRARRGMVATTS